MVILSGWLTQAMAATSACHLQLLGELDLSDSRGSPTLEAQINGKPLRMIVDTGSEFTVLFRDGAHALGLSLRPLTDVDFYGATGQSHVMETNVTELKGRSSLTLHQLCHTAR